MTYAIPSSRIRPFADLRIGDYLCCFFETDDEHRQLFTQFLRQGLERNEKVLYLSDSVTLDLLARYIRDDGIDPIPSLERGQLEIATAHEALCPDGTLDPKGMICWLSGKTAEAVSAGFSALRVTLDMSWAAIAPPELASHIEMVKRFNAFLPESPCLFVAQYDRRLKFKPELLLEALHSHPFVIIGTEPVDNTQYLPPDEFASPRRLDYVVRKRLADLVDRARTEKALRKSETFFRIMVDQQTDAVSRWLPDSTLTYLNDTCCRYWNRGREELEGKRWVTLHKLPENIARTTAYVADLNANPRICSNTAFWRDPERNLHWILWSDFPIYDEEGNVIEFMSVGRDVTPLKAAEEALRTERDLAERLIDTAQALVLLLDFEGRVLRVNPYLEKITGFRQDEVVGKDWIATFVPEDEHPRIYEAFAHTINVERTRGTVNKIITKDGGTRDIEWFDNILHDGEGRAMGILAIGQDITERRQAQRELEAEKERLAVTLRSIGDAVITTDNLGNVTLLNSIAEQLTGWKLAEAIGHPLEEVFHIINERTRKRCENPVEIVLRTGGVVGLANHTALISRDGAERVIADSGAPIRDHAGEIHGVVLVFRDVTAEIHMQEELSRRSKLDSLGVLAGGIAHDFNNLLAAIAGNISLAQILMPDNERAVKFLHDAERAAVRARDLTQQLLTFAKGSDPLKQVIQLSGMLEDATRFVLTGSRHQCVFQIADDLWPVEIDEGQINQVIHNLVLNADQSMPESGTITIAAENVMIEQGNALPLPAGPYVRVSVTDQGIGISKEFTTRIFDPFFTTKHRGSGLGLTSAYSIVKAHVGYIDVASTLGKGSTFSFYLRAIPRATESPVLSPVDTNLPSLNILIMDDEEMVRSMLAELLTVLGHTVVAVAAGDEAIAMYREAMQTKQTFDLAILDLTIPGGMGGKEAIAHLRAIDPSVRAIASSGYSTDPIMANFADYGFCARLAKPYHLSELQTVLAEAIATRV